MLSLVSLLCLVGTSRPWADVVVSPVGNDTWAGTRSRPFKTLEKARDAVRALRQREPNLDRPVVVRLISGTYELDGAFQLYPQDSGTPSSPTLYIGDKTVISGGRQIHGFHMNDHGWWIINLPEVRSAGWRFTQLFVNGQRRYRPRFPKHGYYNFTSEVPSTEANKGHGYDRFAFRSGDILSSWQNLKDIEVLCFHTWDMSRMRIGSIDDDAHIVTTTGPTGFNDGWANFAKGNRFIVENVQEALGEPGEWYLNNQTGDLTYIPMPGEKIESSSIVAPRIPCLLDIKGDVASHRFVSHVGFQGLTFAYSNWTLGPSGRFFPQAEVDLGAVIHAEGWRDSHLDGCKIIHTGEYGVELIGGCQKDTITSCMLSDLGAGGIKIGETKMYDDEQDTAQEISVSKSEIAHGGRLHPAAIGVWIGQSSHNTVEANHIFDLYYTGVSIGWTWGYSKSQAHHNRIVNNDIFDIGQGVLSDMGGIYTLGIEPGTELIGNRIHDVDSFSYGGWGIYPDEGSSRELIENNLVYRTKSGGFHQHYGQENLVRNNIFSFAREAEIIRTRAEDHLSFTFEHNIVYWKDAPLLGSNWSGSNYKLDHNVYWRIDGKPVDFAGMSLESWNARGQDVHSLIADPLFANPERGDFRLQPESPALKAGFKPFLPMVKDKSVHPRVIEESSQPPAFPIQKVNG